MICIFFCRDCYACRVEEKGKFSGIISIHDFHFAGMQLSQEATKESDLRSVSSLLQMGFAQAQRIGAFWCCFPSVGCNRF